MALKSFTMSALRYKWKAHTLVVNPEGIYLNKMNHCLTATSENLTNFFLYMENKIIAPPWFCYIQHRILISL